MPFCRIPAESQTRTPSPLTSLLALSLTLPLVACTTTSRTELELGPTAAATAEMPSDLSAAEAGSASRSSSERGAESRGPVPDLGFFAQRAYPYDRIPVEQLRETRQKHLRLRALQKGEAEPIWTPRGPTRIAGRITDLAVDPRNSDTVFAATASGGVFRSFDAGQSWQPIFDEMPTLSIGDVTLDPVNPDIVYVGTGESNPDPKSTVYGGAGVYRSLDQGATWTHLGLENSGAIGRIVIDPTDNQRIFVAVAGLLWQSNPERGVYRSTDGGATWENVLFASDTTGCVDLIQRPDQPDTLLAAMWQRIRRPEYRDMGGPESAVYRSTDGGDNWTLVEGGLPAPGDDIGRIGLSLSAGHPDIVHAIYADRSGDFAGIYRSENGGDTWVRTNDSSISGVYSTFGWWFGNIRSHPTDPDTLYVLGQSAYLSTDAGQSYSFFSSGMHVDHHALEFGPEAVPVLYAGNDGGVYRSVDSASSWTKLYDLPISQIYRIALDPNQPAGVYIGMQDNGTYRATSFATDQWEGIWGGDGFQALVHPQDSNRFWMQSQYGNLWHSPDGGASAQPATGGSPGGSDRVNWDMPVAQDPTDPDIRYLGTHRLHRSISATSWTAISDDLTGGEHLGNRGSVNGTLTTISASPADNAVIWTGSDDGYVQVTQDGGASWTLTSDSLPERWITSVRADTLDRQTAYVSISGFRWGENMPRIYRTTDLGNTWTAITTGLPDVPVNDLLIHPTDNRMLFAATDLGVFVSQDYGANWSLFGPDLPNVVVTSMALDLGRSVLVVGTYGRSVFEATIPSARQFFDGFESGNLAAWDATSH